MQAHRLLAARRTLEPVKEREEELERHARRGHRKVLAQIRHKRHGVGRQRQAARVNSRFLALLAPKLNEVLSAHSRL